MKKCIFVLFIGLCASLISLPSAAQSYDKLWKKAEADIRNDLPQSALASVNAVFRKAKSENNDAQMLRASLMRHLLWKDIAPDSGKVMLKHMETAHAREMRPIERAMWASALAQTHATFRNDTAHRGRARMLFQESLDSFPLLGQAPTAQFLPLLKQGKHSSFFSDDLLHVLLQAALSSGVFSNHEKQALRGRAIHYYRRNGMRESQLLLTLDSLRWESFSYGLPEHDSTFTALCRLAEDFADLPLNVETYITLCDNADKFPAGVHRDSVFFHLAEQGLARHHREKRSVLLQNFIEKLKQPQAEWLLLPETLYPGKEYAVSIAGKNVRQVELRFYRLDATNSNKHVISNQLQHLSPTDKRPTLVLTHRFTPEKPYRITTDTVRFTAPETGIYLCRMLMNGRETTEKLLHVSRIKPMILKTIGNTLRIIPADAVTGAATTGGRLKLFHRNTHALIGTYEADGDGAIRLSLPGQQSFRACLSTQTDDTAAPFSLFSYGVGYRPDTIGTQMRVYTDRGIYRPGQTVSFAGVIYYYAGDEYRTLSGISFPAVLHDSQGKEVATLTLCSDEMGNFSGSFVLPEICMPGQFNIVCGQKTGTRGGANFRVEEYKRPTFSLTSEAPSTGYALGDTVMLSVRAITYTDLPLSSLKVRYTITTSARLHGHAIPEIHGETLTDSLGRCFVAVPLIGDKTGQNGRKPSPYDRYHYRISMEATADNGETASASHTLYAASQPAFLSVGWPDEICREQLPEISIGLTNSSGKELTVAGTLTLRKNGLTVATVSFRTGRPFVPKFLNGLPSGRYTVITTLDGRTETDTCRIKLFSENDTRPLSGESFHRYIRRNEQGDTVRVIVGSAHREVWLHYDLLTADTLVESRRIAFSDSLLRFDLSYRPEYGPGALACFAFVKDDTLHHFSVPIERPRPDKRLHLTWSTFRSRLTPGQAEEWRLRITRPDGSPADASVMARLYDASLDALAPSPWRFGIFFPRYIPRFSWHTPNAEELSLSGWGSVKTRKAPTLAFTQWDNALFSLRSHLYRNDGSVFAASASTTAYARPRLLTMNRKSASADAGSGDGMFREAAVETEEAQDENTDFTVDFRSNFSETAFFMPQLRTDADGTVLMAFTLPESLTSWKFTAFAHSARMDYGWMDTTVVARRQFMVQAAMPRFVRAGDRVSIPATLKNMSDKEISGQLVCRIAEAKKEKMLHTFRHAYHLKPGESRTVEISFPTDEKHPLLLCRFMAEGDNFSDGEEHFLPVLSDRASVLRTLPFSMTEAGTRTLRIDTLWSDLQQADNRRLYVELSAQPMGYVLSALPAIFNESGESATQRATQLYAVALADFIAQSCPDLRREIERLSALPDSTPSHEENILARHPELKQVFLAESPWEAEATAEAERRKALRQLFNGDQAAIHKQSAIDRLRELQTPEGGWAWFRGMPANAYITADVAVVLARLLHLTGENAGIHAMLQRAMAYWEREIRKEVKAMKENEQRTHQKGRITENQLRYLYVNSLLQGRKSSEAQADIRFLCERAELWLPQMNMHDKALTAVILQTNKKEEAAQTALRSLLEHTVSSPEMGRYFDTQRAPLTSAAYKIPTQVATIEALRRATSTEIHDFTEEMRLWLLQSKRTQMWETSRASADAIYALMLGDCHNADSVFSSSDTADALRFSLLKGRQPLFSGISSKKSGSALAGHALHSFDEAAMLQADRVRIEKQSSGLSWGAVMAHYTLPAGAITGSGNGLLLKEEWQIKEGSTWRTIDLSRTTLGIGQHVRRVFTLTAERDFDFVSLRTSRAACLTPARPLSGYFHADGIHGYRAVHDASTDFFFEKLNKGNHVFTEEYLTDRPGIYQSGSTSAQCVYAPEFSAQTGGNQLQVQSKSSGENSSCCPSAN